MPSQLAEAYISIRAKSARLGPDLAGAMASAKASLLSMASSLSSSVGGVLSTAMRGAWKLAAVGFTAGLSALAGGGLLAGFTTKLASDAEEAGSKFGIVFGSAAESTGKSLDEFAVAAGRSKNALRAMGADIGALVGPMGLTSDQTSDMSVQVVKLATDLASFNNISPEVALEKLRAGLVGEAEPLRSLGVQLNEGKIQAEAFALGLAKTKEEVTGAAKAQAIMSLVMKETANAQGDAARTSGSFANQFVALKGALLDAGTTIGTLFLPAATKIVSFLREGVLALQANMGQFTAWGTVIGEIAGNVLNAFKSLASMVGGFFGKQFTSLITGATGGGITSISDFVTKALDMFAVLTTNLPATWELIKIGFKIALLKMGDSLKDSLNLYASMWMGVWGGIGAGAGAFVDYIKATFEEIGNLASALGAAMKAAFAAAFDGTDPVKAYIDAFTKTLASQKNVVVPIFGEVISAGYKKSFDKVRKQFDANPQIAELTGKARAQWESMVRERDKKLFSVPASLEAAAKAAGVAGGRSGSLAALEAERAGGVPKVGGNPIEEFIPMKKIEIGRSGLTEFYDKIQSGLGGQADPVRVAVEQLELQKQAAKRQGDLVDRMDRMLEKSDKQIAAINAINVGTRA